MSKDDKLTPFSFVNAINQSKKDLMIDENGEHSDLLEKVYNPFIVNRSLSYFNDTVLYANEMNKWSTLDSKLQFDYLRNTIRKRKRFAKWIKPEELESITAVKEYYKCSNDKAEQFIKVLSENQIRHIKTILYKGGRT